MILLFDVDKLVLLRLKIWRKINFPIEVENWDYPFDEETLFQSRSERLVVGVTRDDDNLHLYSTILFLRMNVTDDESKKNDFLANVRLEMKWKWMNRDYEIVFDVKQHQME